MAKTRVPRGTKKPSGSDVLGLLHPQELDGKSDEQVAEMKADLQVMLGLTESAQWTCRGWTTVGGRQISIGKGWDHQVVDVSMDNGVATRVLKMTPHQLSDLFERYPARLDAFGPGFVMSHAIEQFCAGKWGLTDEDMEWAEANQATAPTPAIFPDSNTFGGAGLWGASQVTDEAPHPRTLYGLPESYYEAFKPAKKPWYENIGGNGKFGSWINLRIRRLRQRKLLGKLARRMGSKLPW